MDSPAIWREFLELVSADRVDRGKIRPHDGIPIEPLLIFVKNRGRELAAGAEAVLSQIFCVDDKIHCLACINGVDYCFSILVENGNWYFHHVECIYVRLDTVKAPSDSFPDIPEKQKSWIRQEIDISHKVRVYNYMKNEKGRDFSLSWMYDGAGYFLSACTWIPFLKPEKAFILYTCWQQAKLIGNPTVLEVLEDNHAVIRLEPMYIEMYHAAAHLSHQIEYAEYMNIFEALWHDRAEKAGWKLEIKYHENQCVLDFKR